MADLCPVGMLFTRCKSGISHNPEEHVDAVAMSAAIEVLCRMMQTLPAK
jgi:allantoate deiminase